MPESEEHEDTLVEAPVASGLNQNSAFHDLPLYLEALLLWINLDVDKMPYTPQVLDKSGTRYWLRGKHLLTNDQHNCNEIRSHFSLHT